MRAPLEHDGGCHSQGDVDEHDDGCKDQGNGDERHHHELLDISGMAIGMANSIVIVLYKSKNKAKKYVLLGKISKTIDFSTFRVKRLRK